MPRTAPEEDGVGGVSKARGAVLQSHDLLNIRRQGGDAIVTVEGKHERAKFSLENNVELNKILLILFCISSISDFEILHSEKNNINFDSYYNLIPIKIV